MITGFLGLYQNKTFGLHPIFGARIGVQFKKSIFNLASELRFGKSANNYEVLINDSIVSTNFFYGQYLGFEYDRILISKARYDINPLIGLGYDWFKLPDTDDVVRKNGGVAFNIGLGFLYKMKNDSGPQIQLLYHFGKIDNTGGTLIQESSFVLRLTYLF